MRGLQLLKTMPRVVQIGLCLIVFCTRFVQGPGFAIQILRCLLVRGLQLLNAMPGLL